MSKINWVGILGSAALVGATVLTAGCWNGSGIKTPPADTDTPAGKGLITAFGNISPASFADYTSGFANEVNAGGLLSLKSLPASLGTALADAAGFFLSQNGATGATSFGSLTVTITNPGTPVVTIGGTVGAETLNLTINNATGSGSSFGGAFASGSNITTSSGPGETLTFNTANVGVDTSTGLVATSGDISLSLGGGSPVVFATSPSGNFSNYYVSPCKNGTYCLSLYDLAGTFSQGANQWTGHLKGTLVTPSSFDPNSSPSPTNVPSGAYDLLITSVNISGVPANTTVGIGEELSGYYNPGSGQTPVGEFQVRVEQGSTELFQIQIDTSAPASGAVVYTANLSNPSGVLMVNNPFTGETGNQVGQVKDNGTVLGTLTPGSGGALTVTYVDASTSSLFDVTAVEGTVASIFN